MTGSRDPSVARVSDDGSDHPDGSDEQGLGRRRAEVPGIGEDARFDGDQVAQSVPNRIRIAPAPALPMVRKSPQETHDAETYTGWHEIGLDRATFTPVLACAAGTHECDHPDRDGGDAKQGQERSHVILIVVRNAADHPRKQSEYNRRYPAHLSRTPQAARDRWILPQRAHNEGGRWGHDENHRANQDAGGA